MPETPLTLEQLAEFFLGQTLFTAEGNAITLADINELLPDTHTCDNCSLERPINTSRLVQTDSGFERWCSTCFSTMGINCNDCSINLAHSAEHPDEEGYCVECGNIMIEDRRSNEDEGEDGIMEYDARISLPPKQWPGYPARNDRYFGIELEVEVSGDSSRYDSADHVKSLVNEDYFILKHDGSLDYGFEIVSAPATLEKVPTLWEKLIRNAPGGLKSERTDTCGMHVHVSRKSLTPLTLGKLLVFMNSNHNADLIVNIAGRADCEYCVRKPKLIKHALVQYSPERYEVVNITGKTIEFRLFRGTLTWKKFMKNVEFCDAAIEFCSQTSMKQLTKEKFLEWMKGQSRKTYPNLKKFLFGEKNTNPKLTKRKAA